MFSIVIGSQPKRFLKKCENKVCIRITNKIKHLASNPYPRGVKNIKGDKAKSYRVRVGNYRIKYLVENEKKEIGIYEIEKRSRAY